MRNLPCRRWRALHAAAVALGWSLAAQAQTPISFKQESAGDMPGLGQWLVATLACVALLVLLLWLLKKHGGRIGVPRASSARRLRVVERTALHGGVVLATVEYEGRRLLIATGASHTTCLRDDPVAATPIAGVTEERT